jgi:sugar-specific transcriptional regulator TrmB
MKQMFEKYLQEIGLNDKEAAVYVTLLGFENASVLDVANKTNIKRPTVYTALDSLAKKGLVSETTVGKKTHYYAELPEKLETFVERRMTTLKESQRTLKEIIPQLKSLSRESGEKPIVKYFEGKEGIISATEETMGALTQSSDEPIYFIYSKDLLENLFSNDELQKMKMKRISKNVKSKTLYTYEKGDLESDKMAERIKINAEKYPISCDIAIYNDTVRISVLGKRISSIFIKNKAVAETMKSLFKLVYDSIKS